MRASPAVSTKLTPLVFQPATKTPTLKAFNTQKTLLLFPARSLRKNSIRAYEEHSSSPRELVSEQDLANSEQLLTVIPTLRTRIARLQESLLAELLKDIRTVSLRMVCISAAVPLSVMSAERCSFFFWTCSLSPFEEFGLFYLLLV